jgi:hypothetical protein
MAHFYDQNPDAAAEDRARYESRLNRPPAQAPSGGGGGGDAAPAPQTPAVGGIVPAGSGGASNVPAGGGSPAMAGLSQVAMGEGFREGFNREGWGDQGVADLTIPGKRQVPASSRALSSLVSGQGKAY